LSELEKRHDTEIGNLNHLVDTARWAGRIAWGAITLAALVAAPIVYAIFVHIYHAAQKLLF
jgi:cytochrome c oxidase subunit IV